AKGLIRVSLPVPTNADFHVISVQDPNNCPDTTANQLALFRRPLPSTNVKFLTTVMWDGRESFAGNSIEQNLKHQAMDATLGHAAGAASPSDAQLEAIVNFQMQNFTAQAADNAAGHLGAQGASGGAVPLAKQDFVLGINDPLGPNAAAFNRSAFTLFTAWG